MKLERMNWTPKTILIELLTLLAGLFSVIVYNRVFDDSIPPLLGIVVGAINATLVGFCINGHRDQPDIKHGGAVADHLHHEH
jgi:hypothetical protein